MSAGDGEKRSVTTDALETLGKIITENEKRDAIHLAVENIVAKEWLKPGQHVTVDGYGAKPGKGHGIVDPFLREPVRPEQRCWLVVYPREITSLRHVWTHPAFPDVEAAPVGYTKESSEKYLRGVCALWDGPDYETFIKIATEGSGDWDEGGHQIDEGHLTMNGSDAHGEIPPDVWDHVENVTGKKCKFRPEYFSCSC